MTSWQVESNSENVFTDLNVKSRQAINMNKEYTPKILDLPTEHLNGAGEHYIPPRTRDSTERDRRHSLPSGTILLEQQHTGIGVMLATIPQLESPEALDYSVDMFAPSLMNSAWYQYGRGFEGMRRQIELESMVDDEGNFLTSEQRVKKLLTILTSLYEMTGRSVQDHVERRGQAIKHRKIGRLMGDTATTMVSIGIGNISESAELRNVKLAVRERSQRAIRLGRSTVMTHGAYPSVAQFATADSDALVAWRRDSTNEAYEAMEVAFASIDIKA